jgi:DNA-binding NarL/FixJ family response regulator
MIGKLRTLSFQFHVAYSELKKISSPCPGEPVQLTAREKDVLSLVAEGKSDSVIAEILDISHRAVRFHISNIFKKLDAYERTFATVKALRQGLILPSFLDAPVKDDSY